MPTLPGWSVPSDLLKVALPEAYSLREDGTLVYVCFGDAAVVAVLDARVATPEAILAAVRTHEYQHGVVART